jgi:hypothetical protein
VVISNAIITAPHPENEGTYHDGCDHFDMEWKAIASFQKGLNGVCHLRTNLASLVSL